MGIRHCLGHHLATLPNMATAHMPTFRGFSDTSAGMLCYQFRPRRCSSAAATGSADGQVCAGRIEKIPSDDETRHTTGLLTAGGHQAAVRLFGSVVNIVSDAQLASDSLVLFRLVYRSGCQSKSSIWFRRVREVCTLHRHIFLHCINSFSVYSWYDSSRNTRPSNSLRSCTTFTDAFFMISCMLCY